MHQPLNPLAVKDEETVSVVPRARPTLGQLGQHY